MSTTIEKLHSHTLPAIPLRAHVIFPQILSTVDIARKKSIKTIETVLNTDRRVFVLVQKDATVEVPGEIDVYPVGVIAKIKQSVRTPDKQLRLVLEGVCRAEMTSFSINAKGGIVCDVIEKTYVLPENGGVKGRALIRHTLSVFENYAKYIPKMSKDTLLTVDSLKDPGLLADYIASNLLYKFEDKMEVLSAFEPLYRLDTLCVILEREIEVLKMEDDLYKKTRDQMDRQQQEFFLREQMKIIQSELGGSEEYPSETAELADVIKKLTCSDTVREKLLKDVHKLNSMPFGAPEATVIRGYLDVCLELPWGTYTKDRLDIKRAKKILDHDHDGMEKVKERILEYLAVKHLSPDLKGQILCLVGAPGVGKTSIGASIARALNRKYVRMSLGGVRDEADIRGHRKTYIGSMPGRVVNAIKLAGSMNPLIVLDEIDKLTRDAHGDPASALLEVLDSEQNHSFRDHYLELPLDLTECIFIATANTTDTIPRALLDRMEIIQLPSYTDNEKISIAKHHLIPKQLKRHGLSKRQMMVTDDAIREMIIYYTHESGVRNLERIIATLCRKVARKIADEEVSRIRVNTEDLIPILGRHTFKRDPIGNLPEVGVVNGLAWTEQGGEMLKVEVLVLPGSGKIELTGLLGDVMKESARAAISLIRSRANEYGIINSEFYKDCDIHIHFPEGAVPKDGPSAGIAVTTAMISALCGIPVKNDVAMTGEITLRGKVLPIGGLREKTMAAYTAGIKTVILPADNADDLEDIDHTVRKELSFVLTATIDEVLAVALAQHDKNHALIANAPIPMYKAISPTIQV
jgi:ATP-dependent Lon protease